MAEFLIEKEVDENWVVSPDGSTIFIACNDGNVRSYDAATGSLISETMIGSDLDAIAISPDGSMLLVSLAGLKNETEFGDKYSATAQIALLDLTSPDIYSGEYYFATFDVPVSGDDRGIADLAMSEYGEVLLSLHSVSGASASLFSFDLGSMTLTDLGDVAGDGTALSLTPTTSGDMALVGELGQSDSRFSLVMPDGFTFRDNETWAPGQLDYATGVEAVSGSVYEGFIAVFTDGELKVFDKEFNLLGVAVSYDGYSGDIAALAFGADGSTLYALDNLAGTITSYAISFDEFEGPQIVELGSVPLNELAIEVLPYGIEMSISPDGSQALLNTSMGIVSVELGEGGGGGTSDVLVGTDGDDILDGGDGADEMTGLLGNDTYFVDNIGDQVIEEAFGGEDTVITSLGTYTLPDHVENLDIYGDAGQWNLTGNALGNQMIFSPLTDYNFWTLSASGLGGDDVIDASALTSEFAYPSWTITLNGDDGNDTLVGSAGGNNELYGGAGDDVLIAAGAGSSVLDGGTGADVLDAGAATGYVYFYVDDVNDVVIPGIGTDTWTGNPTNYVYVSASYFAAADGIWDISFQGSGYAQSVVGTDTTNHIRNMDALDTAAGGGGNDYYYLTSGSATVIEEEDGGYDRVSLGYNIDYTMPIHVEEATIFGSSSTLTGNVQDNVLAGQGGTFLGGAGNDTYRIWDTGTIIENPDEGVDTVIVYYSYSLGENLENLTYREGRFSNGHVLAGNELANVITGSNGNETLRGMDGDDVIYADVAGAALSGTVHANDYLFGGGGNDTLYAVYGNDTLRGEAGFDTLHSGAGNDYLDGGNGTDTASYATAAAGVTVSLGITGPQNTTGAGIDTLVSIENLTGSDFADTLTGDEATNVISGGLGADTIAGEGGSDRLYGGDGDDVIEGGTGWDRLQGDDGNDTLRGGNGGDFFSGGDGNDLVYGDAGTDRAYLGAGDDTAYGGTENDLLNGQGGHDTLHGDEGDDELVGATGRDTLHGGADNDLLNGGAHNDLLFGDDGDDVLIGHYGVDQLTGGTGADIFRFDTGHTSRWMGNADVITDFNQSEGDIIDLSSIDAIAGGGDDAFTFIGTDAFSGTAGELKCFIMDGSTFVAGDTDGDGVADFYVRLEGEYDLTSVDFGL